MFGNNPGVQLLEADSTIPSFHVRNKMNDWELREFKMLMLKIY